MARLEAFPMILRVKRPVGRGGRTAGALPKGLSRVWRFESSRVASYLSLFLNYEWTQCAVLCELLLWR
jgi:hypothetical protein